MDTHRRLRSWRIREGDHYIFHLDPSLYDDAELGATLAGADECHRRILHVLGQDENSMKGEEQTLKANYWIYAASVLEEADTDETPASRAYGTANAVGVHFAQRNMGWQSLMDQMTHEQIHLVWGREVGQVPALLNEGVAVYYELVLSPHSAVRTGSLADAWRDVVVERGKSLRELSANDGFWEVYRQGLPVYGVGGALAAYLIEVHGLSVIKAIFRISHYEDDRLAAVIERETGLALEVVQDAVAEWLRQWASGQATGVNG
jgi:hypothetical protein